MVVDEKVVVWCGKKFLFLFCLFSVVLPPRFLFRLQEESLLQPILPCVVVVVVVQLSTTTLVTTTNSWW